MVDPREYSSGVYTEIVQVPSGPRLQLDERSLLLVGPPYLVERKVLLNPCVTGTKTLNIVADTNHTSEETILKKVVGENQHLWQILAELNELTEVVISGTGIPAGTKIVSIDAEEGTITMDNSATATGSAVNLVLTLHVDDQDRFWLFLKDGTHPILKPHIDDYLETAENIRLYYRTQGSTEYQLASGQIAQADYNEEEDQLLIEFKMTTSGVTTTTPAPGTYHIPETAALFADVKVWREGMKGLRTVTSNNISFIFGPRTSRHQEGLTAFNAQRAINISGKAVNIFFPGREDTLAKMIGELDRLVDYYVVPQIRVGEWITPDMNAYDAAIDAFSNYVTVMSSKECRKEKMLYIAYPAISLQRLEDADNWEGDYGDKPEIYNAKQDILGEATKPLFLNNKRIILISEYYGKFGNTDIEGCDIATLVAAERYKLPLTYSTTFDVVPKLTHIRAVGFWEFGELVELKNRGWYALYQNDIGKPVEVYQQVTTEQSDGKLEESNIIVLDSLARTLRATLASMIANGTINRVSRDTTASQTKQTLDRIRAATAAVRAYYVEMNDFLASVNLDDLVVDSNNPDLVYIVLRVEVYYAVNRINTYIFVI